MAAKNMTHTIAPKASETKKHPMVATLRDLQPDDLSPKEALERIYQLKKLV
jgi:DNA mismatch repair protein MutS